MRKMKVRRMELKNRVIKEKMMNQKSQDKKIKKQGKISESIVVILFEKVEKMIPVKFKSEELGKNVLINCVLLKKFIKKSDQKLKLPSIGFYVRHAMTIMSTIIFVSFVNKFTLPKIEMKKKK